MFAKLVALSLLAGAAATPQNAELVSGSDGGLLVSRRQTTSVSDIDVRIAETVGEARTAAATAAYNATLVATMAMTNQMAALQTSVAAQMAAVTAANEAAAARIAAQMSEMQSTSVAQSDAAAAAAAAAGAVLTAQVESLSTAVDTSMAGLSTSVAASLASTVASQTASLATTVAAINVNLTRVVANAPPAIHHSWHGGCSGSKNGGWHWVCLDRVKHDNAAPYFRKSSNERFSSLRPGLFQFLSFSITRSSGWTHHRIEYNGGVKYETHMHGFGRHRGGWWGDTHMNGMLKVPQSGQWWAMRVHTDSWTSWYSEGTHARIEVHYIGKIE